MPGIKIVKARLDLEKQTPQRLTFRGDLYTTICSILKVYIKPIIRKRGNGILYIGVMKGVKGLRSTEGEGGSVSAGAEFTLRENLKYKGVI